MVFSTPRGGGGSAIEGIGVLTGRAPPLMFPRMLISSTPLMVRAGGVIADTKMSKDPVSHCRFPTKRISTNPVTAGVAIGDTDGRWTNVYSNRHVRIAFPTLSLSAMVEDLSPPMRILAKGRADDFRRQVLKANAAKAASSFAQKTRRANAAGFPVLPMPVLPDVVLPIVLRPPFPRCWLPSFRCADPSSRRS
jgi:hypothetical protein